MNEAPILRGFCDAAPGSAGAKPTTPCGFYNKVIDQYVLYS